MARKIMGGDFRAISTPEPVAAEPDPRLALVDLFRDTRIAQTSGVIDLSSEEADYGALFTEDTQEPAEQTQQDTGDSGADEGQEDAGAPPADAEQDEKPAPAESKPEPDPQADKPDDYDPIAAVLG